MMDNLSLAIAILDVNLQHTEARFDDKAMAILRDAWEGVRRYVAWRAIAEAPKDRTVLVFAPGDDPCFTAPLENLITPCRWHEDAGFCVCELREPTHFVELLEPPHGA